MGTQSHKGKSSHKKNNTLTSIGKQPALFTCQMRPILEATTQAVCGVTKNGNSTKAATSQNNLQAAHKNLDQYLRQKYQGLAGKEQKREDSLRSVGERVGSKGRDAGNGEKEKANGTINID